VIGGVDFEGEQFDTLELFDCKSTSEAYANKLVEEDGCDYFRMDIREVNMESAIKL
jgi:hypothetical protein